MKLFFHDPRPLRPAAPEGALLTGVWTRRGAVVVEVVRGSSDEALVNSEERHFNGSLCQTGPLPSKLS